MKHAANLAYRLGILALRFGEVERATAHPDGRRPESDTTHTVMLGLIALELADLVPTLNPGLVVQYALVHDLVEAYCGDTSTFRISPAERAAKAEREAEALAQMRRDYEGTRMVWLIESYEAQQVPEARFVRYLDKATPKITHALNFCTTMRRGNYTREQLVESHRRQLKRLNEQYPELAKALGPVFLELCRASERAWPEEAA